MLLHDAFERTARRLPEKTALVCGERRYTYRELAESAAALATALQAQGVRRGDRIALFLPNVPEMVVGTWAALKVGAVFMPVNAQTKGTKLAYILNDATPVCLVSSAHLSSVWGEAISAAPEVRFAVMFGDGPAPRGLSRPVHRWDALMEASAPALADPGTIDVDLAAIIYTSGSTGDPKGVMLTHLNMLSAARSISTYLELREDDVIYCALPLSFDYGLYQILMGLKRGATVVLDLGFTFPVKCLEVMERERVTVFPGVPTMFSMLMALQNLSRFDLSTLRTITNTAAALSEKHIRELRALFPQARLYSMYGLTECKRVTYLPPDQLDRRPTSVGRGMPNEEVYLVDEMGNRLSNGSTGELVIRGSNVMRGYWRKPEETAKRLKPGPYPGESVLYSGDIFRTDEEGFLYFVARKDDVIKSRGEKVSPREVENALYSHDTVLHAAVIGVPDELLGQAIKAYVVLKPGAAVTEKELIKHCASRLESFMVPTYVERVPELPTTSTGKISTTQLKQTA